jgi:hypothetical protein
VMVMKKFGLLVGNGFTLDLVGPLGLHSSFPLQNFNNRDINYNDFIEKLPAVKDELFGQSVSDFDAIRNYISLNHHDVNKDCQLRRFLALSYSSFQVIVDSYIHQMMNWKWTRWLKENRKGLQLAISLNYDLVLENALRVANISYRRIGSNEPLGKVPILKPHGSIDFDVQGFVGGLSPDNIWTIHTRLNDAGYVNVIPKSEWLLPRFEADIIPPSLHNIQRHLRWVDEMFKVYAMQAGRLDSLIIIGSSYWDVDRPEIDYFLQRLNKKAKVYIMNQNPHPELIKTIQSLGLSYETFGFEDLPW